MAKFLVTWSANPSMWPTDPKQLLGVLEMAAAGGTQVLNSGKVSEMGWLNPQDGFAVFESDSKEAVLGITSGFFPFYNQDVREIVPFASGTEAMLQTARQNASH